jgi:mannose-1-phosphate guanylyltransferase
MLEHTLARLALVTPASHTLVVIGPNHLPHAMPQLHGLADHVVCQPASRGTGMALYTALAMIKRWTPNATVTITPTDHYVDPSTRYVNHVRLARNVASRIRHVVAVLGVRPNEPDPEIGYLSLGDCLTNIPEARRIVGIAAKPSVARAQALIDGGAALWNTMVMCGTVNALWDLGREAAPRMFEMLDCLVPLVGTPEEREAIAHIYRTQPALDFSTDILQLAPERLAAIELDAVEWSDWGRAERIETTLALRRNRGLMKPNGIVAA